MKHKLKMGPNAVLEAIGASVTHSRKYAGDVEWSAEDATRTEFDFLCKAIDVAISSGATVINVPDTVGFWDKHRSTCGTLPVKDRRNIPPPPRSGRRRNATVLLRRPVVEADLVDQFGGILAVAWRSRSAAACPA